MSTWRRLADEQFPELANATIPVNSLVDLSVELSRLLIAALDSIDSKLCQRVVSYAVWAATQVKNEQFLHFTVDVFSPAVRSETLRFALWRELTPSQFSALKRFFVGTMNPDGEATLRNFETGYRLPR